MGDFLFGKLKHQIVSAHHSFKCLKEYHCEYCAPRVTQCSSCVVHVQLIYMLPYSRPRQQQQCVRASVPLRTRTNGSDLIHTHTYIHTHNIQTVLFYFGIGAKVLSLLNQLNPKTKIRLLPVTYFNVCHLYKL